MASKIFPEFQFQWLVDQIKANLPLELDFLNEGKNCEKTRDVLTNFSGIRVSSKSRVFGGFISFRGCYLNHFIVNSKNATLTDEKESVVPPIECSM